MDGVDNAIKNGFSLELDLHKTKDGKFILIHDSDLKRITGQDELVENLNYEDILPVKDNV